LELEAQRLAQESVLTNEEVALLDFAAIADFWDSEVGRRIRGKAAYVHRELAFTARFEPQELSELIHEAAAPGLKDEFVVVQGVADLVVLLEDQIWLVDFKTDTVRESDLDARAEQYTPQLKVYARALSRIHGRPVSECWLCFLGPRRQVRVPA
jgi:ATP-dependent helicase/nuclease subunit A